MSLKAPAVTFARKSSALAPTTKIPPIMAILRTLNITSSCKKFYNNYSTNLVLIDINYYLLKPTYENLTFQYNF